MKQWKIQSEKLSGDSREREGKLSQSQLKILQRKKWTYHQGKLQTPDRKTVIPKSKLYDTPILAHQRTAHRGRQITSKWENDNYSEVSVRLVRLFVSLCPLHEQQKTITSKQESKHKNNRIKISDMMAIKINKVDKINPFHPNMLLGETSKLKRVDM